jgi:hypothetical protein
MRALIAGIVFVGGALSACTAGSSYGTARYSGDAAPTPTVARRDVPTWPSAPSPTTVPSPASPAAPVVTYAPPPPAPLPATAYAPPRTAAPQPIVLSSRPAPTSAPSPIAGRTAMPPARARTAAELAAALRPINATCPVMLGSPVDPSVTASYQGRVVAFSNSTSRSAWLADPERFARNLPGTAGFGSSSDGPVFATMPAPVAAPPAAYVPSEPAPAPAYAPLPPAAARRTAAYVAPAPVPTYVAAPPPAPSSAPATVVAPRPVPVAACPVAPAPAPAAAEADDTGGVCVDGECKGGNCALPPRRK